MLSHLKKLMLGNGLAQALQFFSIIVLSRIYSPGEFGTLAQIQSIATAATVIFTLQLHLSIPQCTDLTQAQTNTKNTQTICFIFFLITAPVSIILGDAYIFSSLLALLLGFNNTTTSLLVFKGDFGSISRFYFFRAASIVTLQIALSWLPISYGLVIGIVSAEFMAAIYLQARAFGSIQFPLCNPKQALVLARRLKAFSIYGTAQEIISVSAFYAPVFMFVEIYGEDTGGQYSMASRLVWAPVVLMSGSLSQILQHRFGRQGAQGIWELRHLFLQKKVIAATAALCIIPFLTENLLVSILGEGWQTAVKMISPHLIWGSIFLLSTPFRVACRILHLQSYQMRVDGFMLLLIIALFFGVTPSALTAMWCLVIIALIQNTLLSGAVWIKMRNENLKALS